MKDILRQISQFPTHSTVLTPLSYGDRQRWTAVILTKDGRALELDMSQVANIIFTNSDVGKIVYGKNPLGHDQLAIHENGGGGAVLVLYALVDDRVYLATVERPRPLHQAAGKVRGVPRFILRHAELWATVIKRILRGQVGAITPNAYELKELRVGVNANNAYMDTHGVLLNGDPEGAQYFVMQLPESDIRPAGDATSDYVLRDKLGLLAIPPEVDEESITASVAPTLRLIDVVGYDGGDAYTLTSIGLLHQHLKSEE